MTVLYRSDMAIRQTIAEPAVLYVLAVANAEDPGDAGTGAQEIDVIMAGPGFRTPRGGRA